MQQGLSAVLPNALEIGSSGERHVPPLVVGAWKVLELREEALAPVVTAIDNQLADWQAALRL